MQSFSLVPVEGLGHLASGAQGTQGSAGGDSSELPGVLVAALGQDAAAAMYELLWHVVQGAADAKRVGAALKTYVSGKAGLQEAAADAFWLVGLEVANNESEEEKGLSVQWKRLGSLLSMVVRNGALSRELAATIVGVELLECADLGDAKVLSKRLIRVNTKLLYRQDKFNLQREESEGFAKLVTELQRVTPSNVDAVARNIRSLIGFFHLDPNRVFDIVLEVLEADPASVATYLPIMDLFRQDNLAQLVGFKFQMYRQDESTAQDSSPSASASASAPTPSTRASDTPRSLFRLAVVLVLLKRLSLQGLLPHLSPSMETLEALDAAATDAHKKRIKSVGRISLSGKPATSDAPGGEASEAEATAARDSQIDQYAGLLVAMLRLRAWGLAREYMRVLKEWRCLAVVLDHAQVVTAFVRFATFMISDMYEAHASPRALSSSLRAAQSQPDGSEHKSTDTLTCEALAAALAADGAASLAKPCTSLAEFVSDACPVFLSVAHRLSSDPIALTKLVRVVGYLVQREADLRTAMASKSPDAGRAVHRLLTDSILPSISLLDSPNPALLYELWAILGEMPCSYRFALYDFWRCAVYDRELALQYARAQARVAAKQVIKRVAKDKEKLRLAARQFAKLTHTNPIVAVEALLNNIQTYDNLIPAVVDSIKYLTPLAFDVVAYLVVQNLNRDDSKLKDDATSHSVWLAALCSFLGRCTKSIPPLSSVAFCST